MAYPFIPFSGKNISVSAFPAHSFGHTQNEEYIQPGQPRGGILTAASTLFPNDRILNDLGLFNTYFEIKNYAMLLTRECNALDDGLTREQRLTKILGIKPLTKFRDSDSCERFDTKAMLHVIHDHQTTIIDRAARLLCPGAIRFVPKVTSERINHKLDMLDQNTRDGASHQIPSIKESERQKYAEQLAILVGLDGLASDLGQTLHHFTITLPRKYHLILCGSDVRSVSDHLNHYSISHSVKVLRTICERARKALHQKLGIKYWSLRVEPHEDGTPHIHLLIWSTSDGASSYYDYLKALLGKVGCNENSSNLVHHHAMDDREIPPSYSIAKYLHAPHEDEDTQRRLRAWQKLPELRNVRLYEHCRAKVSLYRELRRKECDVSSLSSEAKAAQEAARQNDFAGFFRAASKAMLYLDFAAPNQDAPYRRVRVYSPTSERRELLLSHRHQNTKTINTIYLHDD